MAAARKKTRKKEPATAVLWYADHLRGKLAPLTILLVLGVVVALYLSDLIPENVAGVLLGGVVIVAGCGYAAYALLQSTRTNLGGALVVGLGLLATGVALGPVISTLAPGRPLAHGVLSAPGQSLPLPDSLSGAVRLLVRADFGTVTASAVDITFGLGAERVVSHLDRSVRQARIGRRGTGTVVEEHNSQYVSGVVPAGVHELVLGDVRGSAPGGVEVNVFRTWVPYLFLCIIAGALLLAGAMVAGRLRAGPAAPAALAAALLFGLAVYRLATPDAAVRSELGALLVSALLGTISGGTLGWLSTRLIGRRARP